MAGMLSARPSGPIRESAHLASPGASSYEAPGGSSAGSGSGSRPRVTYRGEVRYRVKGGAGGGTVSAYQDFTQDFGRHGSVESSRKVGELVWDSKGKVHDIEVRPDRQRNGIGTRMWKHARQATGGRISHSADRTDAGERFARRAGGRLPPRSSWRG